MSKLFVFHYLMSIRSLVLFLIPVISSNNISSQMSNLIWELPDTDITKKPFYLKMCVMKNSGLSVSMSAIFFLSVK